MKSEHDGTQTETSSKGAPPVQPFELTIAIGAESWDLAIGRLRELANHIAEHGPDCSMVSGSAGSHASVTIVRREVSPGRFRKELFEWFDRQRRGGL